jgi:DNA-binding CsgD family transcriptional regulator
MTRAEIRAIKLVEGGMSQRKAAKLLGVDESTVQADVGGNRQKLPARTGTKLRQVG